MVKDKFFVERKKCPLCNSKRIVKIFSKTFSQIKAKNFFKTHLNNKFPFRILDNREFNISECKKCKILFQKNILNNKYNSKYYNDFIDHKKILNTKNLLKQKNSNFKFEIEMIDRIFKNKKITILEYGAGLGAWVNAIKKSGYKNVFTVEISKKRRDYLKKNKIKSYSNLSKLNKKFDLIYSDQTFEHLIHPGKVIEKLIRLLKPNGCLIFKIPPGIHFKKKLNNNYVAQKDEAIPLEHLNIYTRDTIKFIKKKYKLKDIKSYLLFKIYEKNFLKSLASYFYHLYYAKKFVLQKYKY